MKNSYGLTLLLFLMPGAGLSAAAISTYVGDGSCKGCHIEEHQKWQGSHHDLAMQEANETSVLGDFENTSFIHNGVTSTFYKDNKRFMVNTDGSDGKLHDYEVSYTFGAYPLQQYMIKFPKGKIQVLDIAWDSRNKEQGGQRWYSLHPDEVIKGGDVLHWTGPNLNWNYMCADCHSTNLKKNYSALNKNYKTRWDSINVSCEACHGPASAHLDWAKTKDAGVSNGLTIKFPDMKQSRWGFNKITGKPELKNKGEIAENKNEIEVCARCHSRRTQLTDDYVPGDNFRDHYRPALLDAPLYYPDGKIRDEVFVYGSFQQSRMYAEGVRCSDCHNPHSLKLKATGDNVCGQCHVPDRYASVEHHFHKMDSAGSSCISCHMPAKTYMGVDVRNDHSFRIPRPDLAKSLNMPDACTNCHREKKSQWAADAIKKWHGKTPAGYQQFGVTLQALATQDSHALQYTYSLLQKDAPQIAKATAISYLGSYPSKQTLLTSIQMLRSTDADTRRQALRALESFPIKHTLSEIYNALNDSVKAVRIEAARILVPVSRGDLTKEQKALIDRVTKEYEESLLFVAERPESQLSLARLYLGRHEIKKAETAFKEAIALQPKYIPAYINYANYLKQKDEKSAFKVLQNGIKQEPDASLFHALGLWYIRDRQKVKGIQLIKKAALLAPDNPRYQYVYAVAVGSDDPEKAIVILEKALNKRKGSLELLMALSSYYGQINDKANVDFYNKKLRDVMAVSP